MLKKLLLSLALLLPSAAWAADDYAASPRCFGPNALPVPDMLNGTVQKRFYAEVDFDLHKGFYGDLTYIDSDEKSETITYNNEANNYAVMPYTSVSPSFTNSTFGVSLTNAFLGGLLGRPTKNLPVTSTTHDKAERFDDSVYEFQYTYNEFGQLIDINY